MEKFLYEKIEKDLEAKILKGFFKNNELPTEEVLRKEYNVSRVTLRQALHVLKQKGLIYKIRGKGTFISSEDDKNKIDTIGVVINEKRNSLVGIYTAQMLKGLYDANAKYGYKFKLINFDPKNPFSVKEEVQKNNITCVILVTNVPPDLIEQMTKEGIICVNANVSYDIPSYNIVNVNVERGAVLAAEYLIKQGCKKIGLITSMRESVYGENTQANRVINGFKTALEKRSLKLDNDLIFTGDWDRLTIGKEIKLLLDRGADAIIFSSEGFLKRGLDHIYNMKNDIISKVKLIGMSTEENIYPITTIGIPQTKTAEMSLNLMHLLIYNRKLTGQKISLEPVLRETHEMFR